MKELFKDNPIRSLLSLMITVYVFIFIGYTLIVHGNDKGTLNLLIGFVIGLMTGVMGVYFNSTSKSFKQTGETTAEINATITQNNDKDGMD